MKKLLKNKTSILIVIILLSSSIIQVNADTNYKIQNIEKLSFKEEIDIPIDTSSELTQFQPIDLRIEFSNPSWAIDENHHSVRVGVEKGSEVLEIESQIYDLEYTDESHISSCSLVFLTPEIADGNEKYYVYYDSSETDAANYQDHLSFEDAHYFYEPISGQKIDLYYYGIFEDGYIIYGIIQKGEIIGNPVSHTIAKCIPNAALLETTTIEQLASFDFRHGIKGDIDYTGTAAATKAIKQILIDGNLMVRLKIESASPKGDIITNNIYTYYFCPTETKRIFVNVDHDILKTIEIEDPDQVDGIYTGLITIKSRSKTIEKMNVGDLLPNLNLYDESESIKEYKVPPDPETIERELILSTEDDIDLGSKAWVSLSDPKTGKVHGLIMESNTGYLEGSDDGIQIKSYVKQNIKLPGIEGDTGSVFLGRNAYESGGNHLTSLPQGFHVNFDVAFLTDGNEGYNRVDSESEIIQSLLKSYPVFRGNVTDEVEEGEKYTLTVTVHLAPSAPMGSLLSAAIGRNIPYISAELYKENTFSSAGSFGRLPIGSIDLDFEGKSIFQTIGTLIGMFDWRNISVFKKVKFQDLEPGTYVIKVYKENLLLKRDRQYIGFSIVDLQQNEKVRIFGRPQATLSLSIKDQSDEAVENVKFLLESNEQIIADGLSDENGSIVLNAPCYATKPYILKVLYLGFLVEEKNVKLRFRNRIIKAKESFSIEHHELKLNVKDKWGYAPAVEVNPELTSSEMIEQVRISAEKINEGKYQFLRLYPAVYNLFMKYKSFEVNEKVTIPIESSLSITFPAEYEIDISSMDSYGYPLTEGEISIYRHSKSESFPIDKNGNGKISVPPGRYKIIVNSENENIAEQEVDVRGDKEIDILTAQDSFLHTIIFYLGIVLLIFSILFMLLKKKYNFCIILIIIALLIMSLFSPWWILNGENVNTETTTKTLLIPPKIITLSTSSDLIGGDVSQVPSEVTLILQLLSILIAVTCLLIFITIFIRNKFKRTNTFISILILILLVLTIALFYFVMGQITDVGVGSFMGSGELETNLPGIAESEIMQSSWGPGAGFFIAIFSLIFYFLLVFQKRLYGLIKKLH